MAFVLFGDVVFWNYALGKVNNWSRQECVWCKRYGHVYLFNEFLAVCVGEVESVEDENKNGRLAPRMDVIHHYLVEKTKSIFKLNPEFIIRTLRSVIDADRIPIQSIQWIHVSLQHFSHSLYLSHDIFFFVWFCVDQNFNVSISNWNVTRRPTYSK